MIKKGIPKLGVFKFASCDGCQLSLLDCEEELLAVAAKVQVAYFLEASRQEVEGPYDLVLVEGSITTEHDRKRIIEVRKQAHFLVTIGACATSGGIQALKNFNRVEDYINTVYAHPEYIETLKDSTPISDHVPVDFELRGCPIGKHQLLEVINAFLNKRKPNIPNHSVCQECKQSGTVCLPVAQGIPCLGPVTHAGCGALCPKYNRGCFGCFGPKDTSHVDALVKDWLAKGVPKDTVQRAFHTFNAWAPPFRDVNP